MIQGIIMKNGDVLIASNITKIVPDDYNDPDLEFIEPYLLLKTITDSVFIKPYLSDYTNQTIFSFRSEDILTMFSPKQQIVDEYKKMIGLEEQLELNVDDIEEKQN